MNSQDAASLVVRNYPGGAEAMAARLGDKTPDTLRHELAGQGRYKLGLRDAEAITQFAQQAGAHPSPLAILQSFAHNVGCMVLPLPEPMNLADDDCLRRLGNASTDFATLCGEVANDVAAGRISDNALARIEADTAQLLASLRALESALAARNQANKPAHLKQVA